MNLPTELGSSMHLELADDTMKYLCRSRSDPMFLSNYRVEVPIPEEEDRLDNLYRRKAQVFVDCWPFGRRIIATFFGVPMYVLVPRWAQHMVNRKADRVIVHSRVACQKLEETEEFRTWASYYGQG
jgi:hypothetical protein